MNRTLKELLIILFLAAIVVSIGYYIDEDPPYPSWLKTVKEFCGLTLLVFVLMLLPYSIIVLLRQFIKRVREIKK